MVFLAVDQDARLLRVLLVAGLRCRYTKYIVLFRLPVLICTIGLGVLFGKLQQGCAENQQMLAIARMRAEAEDVYGMRLGEIGAATDRITGGFSRDDGATVRKVGNICTWCIGRI